MRVLKLSIYYYPEVFHRKVLVEVKRFRGKIFPFKRYPFFLATIKLQSVGHGENIVQCEKCKRAVTPKYTYFKSVGEK